MTLSTSHAVIPAKGVVGNSASMLAAHETSTACKPCCALQAGIQVMYEVVETFWVPAFARTTTRRISSQERTA